MLGQVCLVLLIGFVFVYPSTHPSLQKQHPCFAPNNLKIFTQQKTHKIVKLKSKIKIQKIRIIADYRKKENNPMFLSILKAAVENGNILSIENARDRLSGPSLNKIMWSNLLERLGIQGYFEKWNEAYELTEFGQKVAAQNTFFKSLKGELEVWLVKDKISWFPHQVIKVIEKVGGKGNHSQEDKKRKAKSVRIPGLVQGEIMNLKDTAFSLIDWESKWKQIGTETVEVEINVTEINSRAKIEDLEFQLPKEYNHQSLQELFLKQKYGKTYNQFQQVVKVEFDGNIQLQRKVVIEQPKIEDITFDKINLPQVNFMANSENEAQRWRLAWLKTKLEDYIFDQTELDKIDYKIWQQFEPYYKLPILSVAEFEANLEQNPTENFYHLMKLQAPQMLSY